MAIRLCQGRASALKGWIGAAEWTASTDREDMQLKVYELETFAEALTELVRMAKDRGFLTGKAPEGSDE